MQRILQFVMIKAARNIFYGSGFGTGVLALALFLSLGSDALSQPNLTHVDNVNAAGNATLYWDVFTPVTTEEFIHNEIKVFDIPGVLLSPSPHLIAPDLESGVLPTGWVMPSFLYNANAYAHCYTAVQVTSIDGGATTDMSPQSPFLCSIHVDASVGTGVDEVDLVWNSPYAVSGEAAGGPFYLERLNEFTAVWDTIAIVPDNSLGVAFTDNPGPCVSINIYRVRQTASNGLDLHVSNAADLIVGAVNPDLPNTTHVDVDPVTGLAEVFFDYPVGPETLGFIIYKCTGAGSSEVLQIDDPNISSALIATSLASSEPESYRVAAFECINDDGTPNPNAAGDCTTSIFTVVSQIPCTDRAQISWNSPFGIDGGVNFYLAQMTLFDDVSGSYGPWTTLDTLASGFGTYLHEGADVSSTYKYRIVATSNSGKVARSSEYELTFSYPDAPAPPLLQRASVIWNGSVEIFVETDPDAVEISLYQLERWVEIDSIWIPILEPLPSSLGFPLTFVDPDVETDTRSYTYRCAVYNECGVAVTTSNIGKTILLQGWRSTDPEAFENSLIWSEYLDFPQGTSSYEILRSPSRLSAETPLSSHSANEFHAEDYVGNLTHLPGDFCYKVVAIENNPEDGLNGASSNRVCLTEDPLIWIPTAFTPNGDELNDWFPWSPDESTLGFVLESVASGEPTYDLVILSRWGDVIFASNDPTLCWDGTSSDELVPDGVYTVVIRVLDGSGKWHIISQSLQVLRP
ncbi:MAG TPA: gliding motility-associated C-terminal domain-containing protein [Flavobacteriales bacterium]|nr:gliding motility-associated C-terminal domain-containing protein [Flavobacteriales bacterium]HIN42184.1 gliding motility-associated C-terminal domain-containing protein [Flavobacteriales bacterium]HIO15568.1 gliding motility-associated C-terminal domain-containing protein [Flavobacteriales bacterium]